jgi:hypothetical protein
MWRRRRERMIGKGVLFVFSREMDGRSRSDSADHEAPED